MDRTPVAKKLKRVYNGVTIFTKLNAINEIEKGTSIYDIAKELSVHHTTVRCWYKNKDNLLQLNSENIRIRKRIRRNKQDNINRAVWIWFKQTRASGVPITGPMIKAKALEFSSLFKNQDPFTASNGWLRSWKKNFGISLKNICDEKSSDDTEAVEDVLKKEFLDHVKRENLTPHQVFNGAKCRLFYKLIPKTTLCKKKNELSVDVKESQDILTVMACSNASGTLKLPLVIIGESENPRDSEEQKSLPVYHKNQKKAWMTGDLFRSWFEHQFVPIVKKYLEDIQLPCKALLVIDNYSSHNVRLSKNGITVLSSPLSPTLTQPMHQGCLQDLKLLYKQRLMNHTIDSLNKKISLLQAIENITVNEAINWAATAWDNVSVGTIKKSWNQMWPQPETIKSCQGNLSQQQQQINDLFNNFCKQLQELGASDSVEVSELEKWLNSNDLDEEKLSNMDIVDIIRDESPLNIERNDKDLDQMNGESDDDNQSCHYDYEFVEVKCNEDVGDIDEVKAVSCIEYLREYCERNNFKKSIKALDVIEKEIKS